MYANHQSQQQPIQSNSAIMPCLNKRQEGKLYLKTRFDSKRVQESGSNSIPQSSSMLNMTKKAESLIKVQVAHDRFREDRKKQKPGLSQSPFVFRKSS